MQQALHHYLSDHIERLATTPPDRLDCRSVDESRVFQEVLPAYLALARDEYQEAFADVVLRVASCIAGKPVAFRSHAMTVRRQDNAAHTIVLPDAERAKAQVARIGRANSRAITALTPLAMAVWTYVLFLNAHPLSDGNGRTARILFNMELARAGMRPHAYVPIHSAMRHSRGGYEIRLREAEIFGRWNPIMRYMALAVRLSASSTRTVP